MTKETHQATATTTRPKHKRPEMTQLQRIMHADVLVNRKDEMGAVLRGYKQNGMFHYAAIFRGKYLIGHAPSKDVNSLDLLNSLLENGIRRITAGEGVKIA